MADSAPQPPSPLLRECRGHECIGVVEETDSAEIRRGERAAIIPPDMNALAEYISVEPAADPHPRTA